jgi:hypothetical protein
MSRIGRARSSPLTERAVRVRNACVHDLAERTGLPAPAADQMAGVDGSALLAETWDWYCAACVREPVIGSGTSIARRRRVSLLLRVTVMSALVVLALALSASPAGS